MALASLTYGFFIRPRPQEIRTMTVRTQRNGVKTETRDEANEPAAVDRETLIEGLNHDLAGEYQAIITYTHFAAKLTGPYRKELRGLFQAEAADEQGHAQFLADKITVLGGEPTTQPRPTPHADNPR